MTKTGVAARPTLDIEPETFLETLEMYQKPIIVGVIAVAVAVGSIWMWRRSVEIRETRAAEAYVAAEAAFGAGNTQLAQPELERVLERYAGTTAGTQSAMLLAQVLYDQGKFAEGVTRLETALGRAPEALRPGLLSLMANGQEGAGESKKAAESFEKAAAAATFEIDRDQLRMSAARNHLAAGDSASARAIYESIASRDDSEFAGEARVRLGEITIKE